MGCGSPSIGWRRVNRHARPQPRFAARDSWPRLRRRPGSPQARSDLFGGGHHPQNILAGIDLDNPEAVLNQAVGVLLQNNITPNTRKVLEQTAVPASGESKTVDPSKLIALIIGSPEFQRK